MTEHTYSPSRQSMHVVRTVVAALRADGASARRATHQESANALVNLAKIADLHKRFSSASQTPETALPLKLNGQVVALGSLSADTARSYARVTGRSCVLLNDALDLLEVDEVAVVVTTLGHLDYDLRSAIFYDLASAQGCMPGLLVGRTARELDFVAQKWAISMALMDEEADGRTHLLPNINVDAINSHGSDIIGAAASKSTIIEALSAGSAVLYIESNSDGLSLKLGTSHRLCSVLDEDRSFGDGPLCQTLNRCTSLHGLPPLRDALEDKLVRPDVVSARVLILSGCHMFRGENAAIGRSYNLAAAISRQSSVGACIASWKAERERPIADGMLLHGLLNDISTGMPLGLAVHDANTSQSLLQADVNYCLLGDPAYRVRLRARPPALPISAVESVSRPQRTKNDPIDLMRRLVEEMPRSVPMKDFPDRLRLLEMLSSRSCLSSDGAMRLTSKMFARFFSCWSNPTGVLIALLDGLEEPIAAECPYCDRDVLLKSASGGRFFSCLRCGGAGFVNGVALDLIDFKSLTTGCLRKRQPADTTTEVLVHVLNATYPKGAADGSELQNSAAIWWPTDGDGALEDQCPLPETLPEGSDLFCNVYAVQRLRFGCWSRPFRPAARL